jgi:hypothetical protein
MALNTGRFEQIAARDGTYPIQADIAVVCACAMFYTTAFIQINNYLLPDSLCPCDVFYTASFTGIFQSEGYGLAVANSL